LFAFVGIGSTNWTIEEGVHRFQIAMLEIANVVVKKDKVKRQEQRGDKQLEKPKKMPQQPSNPATQQPDDQIIHPFLLLVRW
tara:strand:- start:383 stop:628 length:246 start_codon:yes stop_codon:yes gene_type:complete